MKVLIIFLCAGFIITGCKKTGVAPYESEGTITGYDLRTCASCGGLEIVIKNDTTKNAPPFYDINSTLQQLGIDENTKFPIDVDLNWKHDIQGLGNIIIVSKIQVIGN
jgi:hypothetical protein